MALIIGLGNPGSKYAGTRHNIGFEFLDLLADEMSVRLGPGKGSFYTGKGNYGRYSVHLIRPTTFMNNSGKAVSEAINWYKKDIGNCLICYDDLDLDVGTIRLRPGGSAGGHNGIQDIINKTGTNAFPRLRIGIGNDFPKGQQVQHVLSPFSDDERSVLNKTLKKAVDATFCFIRENIETAMNNFN